MGFCMVVYRIEIDAKLPIFGNQKWVIWICSFNIPMAPGKTRSIVCSARNFFQFSVPGPAWWQVNKLWLCLFIWFANISLLMLSLVRLYRDGMNTGHQTWSMTETWSYFKDKRKYSSLNQWSHQTTTWTNSTQSSHSLQPKQTVSF